MLALLPTAPVLAATSEQQTTPEIPTTPEEQVSAELARQFYQQVWFSDHPGVVDQLFVPEYVIHDTGGIDGFIEPAEMQKGIVGFLRENGQISGTIDYQIVQGDLGCEKVVF